MKQLEHMKNTLMNCVQGQMGDLSSVNAQELGEAVDMIKDLEEAIYYATITKAMNEEKEGKEKHFYHPYPMYEQNRYYGDSRNYMEYNRDMDKNYGRMYYEGNYNYARGVDGSRQSSGESRNYPVEIRDYREGRSPMTRRTYMENKEMHKGTPHQMQELEKYMHELSDDLIEMITGASPEEKQMMQKKLSALATKIV